ncbi:M20/M25/M40 family metallo-hydrolase [Kytococcus schroeteri]|uniref:M20/M25/M40 family metallo-hydrolase n=1 Tax=Kytococcus schroeteri TaxID=138300 RepID=UPI0011436B96|nr:M20/M25/M40 family metallo-hydrolase [Kytococcus schroeteri]
MRRTTLSALIASPVAAVSLAGLALSSTAMADSPDLGPESAAVVDFKAPNGGVDTSTRYVVTTAAERAEHFGATTALGTVKDASGQKLVISRTTADQIARMNHGEAGERGPGFRSFATRAEAEAFVQNDRTAQTVGAALDLPPVDNQDTVNPWLDEVQEESIRKTITDLSTTWPNRYYASSHGKAAAAYVHDAWTKVAGDREDVTVAYDESCGSDCGNQSNVTMTVKGTENPEEIVVIGAHFDSVSNAGQGDDMDAPGADDNASATATVTEVARVALESGWKPKRTVVFAAYAAEEVGLVGSNAMAQSFASEGKDVVGVLNLDMTNYDGGQADMAVMEDNVSTELTAFNKEVFNTYLEPKGMTLGSYQCGYGCSDHSSWTSAGYPASMMAESELSPYIHTPDDTLENAGGTADHSVKFAQFGLAFLGEMAKTGA